VCTGAVLVLVLVLVYQKDITQPKTLGMGCGPVPQLGQGGGGGRPAASSVIGPLFKRSLGWASVIVEKERKKKTIHLFAGSLKKASVTDH
jgi:hypothetical protein